VNAGVSGDTTSGGLDRLGWLLEQKPDVLVVGLGVNDAFRGQPVDRIEANLRAIVAKAKAAGARVVLLGMRVPTNYGPEYTEAFAAIYSRVAKKSVDLMPFLLTASADADLNLEDASIRIGKGNGSSQPRAPTSNAPESETASGCCRRSARRQSATAPRHDPDAFAAPRGDGEDGGRHQRLHDAAGQARAPRHRPHARGDDRHQMAAAAADLPPRDRRTP
jgi:hypothetical protein